MWWCFFLTFQSLRQEAVCACRWRYSTVRVAEAGRSHAVGGVLKESVQQPETIWVNITENVTHQTQLEKKKNNVRRSPGLLVFEPHLSVCGCRRYSSNLRTVRCDLRPLKVFGTVPGWEPLPPLPSPASTPPDLRQEKKNPNRLISHINIYRWMELLQGHRPTLWHTLKIPSDTLRHSLNHSDLLRYSDSLRYNQRYSERQQLVPWSFRFLAMTIPSSGNRAILQPEA